MISLVHFSAQKLFLGEIWALLHCVFVLSRDVELIAQEVLLFPPDRCPLLWPHGAQSHMLRIFAFVRIQLCALSERDGL